MASRLLRRSGISVGLVAEVLGWRPDWVIQVGVGLFHEEADALREKIDDDHKEEHVLKSEWPDCRFVGFEPHPGTFRQVEDSYPGHLIQKAISDRHGTATFYMKKRHADGSSLHFHDLLSEDERSKVSKFDVELVTLDSIFTNGYPSGKILLWLDCEGSELAALRGGESLLERVEVVNVEMASKPPSSGWCSPGEVHVHLAARGFWLQWIHTQRISAGQCDVIYVRSNLFRPEYCCVPHEVERFNKRGTT